LKGDYSQFVEAKVQYLYGIANGTIPAWERQKQESTPPFLGEERSST